MFADDTTLLASTREDLISMIRDVRDALAKHGLNLNLDKCIVQTNTGNSANELKIDGVEVTMVSLDEGFKILGTKFMLSGRT